MASDQAHYAARLAATQAPAVPAGWKLLKDSTRDERSWPEDFAGDNGRYFNTCATCERVFAGHKRRITCKVCHG